MSRQKSAGDAMFETGRRHPRFNAQGARKLAFELGALWVAAWTFAGCGAGSPSSSAGEARATGSSVAGSSPSYSSAGAEANDRDLALGNQDGGGSGGVEPSGLPNACATKTSTVKPVALDIYIMLDASGSMLELTAALTSKWSAVRAALETFLNDKASAGLGVGLQFFPLIKPDLPASCSSNAQCGDSAPCFLNWCWDSLNVGNYQCESSSDCPNNGACTPIARCSKDNTVRCRFPGEKCISDDPNKDLGKCTKATVHTCINTSSCDVDAYATPASPIRELPGAATDLVASIDAKMPGGGTPTGPALSGAIQRARAWALAHPDHRVVSVLVTDGAPTNCTPTDVAAVAAIAQAGVATSPSVSTFVVGVFGDKNVEQGAPQGLNQIAQKGGTNSAFIVDTKQDVAKQLLATLDTIRGARLACQFQVPEPAGNESLDYGRVNVNFTSGAGKSIVYYVENASACDSVTGGWYYDVDPGVATPSKIIACPTSCASFQQATTGASLEITLGCVTLVK